MKSGIIRGEAICTLRNTTLNAELLKDLCHIFKGLMARGYPPEVIKKKWKTVRFGEREFYIITSTLKTLPEGTIRGCKLPPRRVREGANYSARRGSEDAAKILFIPVAYR